MNNYTWALSFIANSRIEMDSDEECPQTSTGSTNFLQKCRDYISQKFTSVVHNSDNNGSNKANVEENSFESSVVCDIKSVLNNDKSKQKVKQKDNSFENDARSEKKAYTSLECGGDITKRHTVEEMTGIPACTENIRLHSSVAGKKEMEKMVQQENDFNINEHEKEILHLQDKVLRLQEKICRLQKKVSTLQGVHLQETCFEK